MPQVPSSRGPQVALGITPGAQSSVPQLDIPDVRLNTPRLDAPTIRNNQVRTSRLQPSLKDPNAIRTVQLSDRGASQTIALGQSLGGAADALGRAVLNQQVKINATIVDDALNDAREKARQLTWGVSDGKGGLTGGYRNVKGYDAINRESGKPLDDEVAEAFDTSVKDIVKSKLKSADQRTAFDMQVNDLSSQLRQGATTWQSEQFDSYHSGVYKGMVSNLTQDFALRDPTDLDGQKKGLEQIEQAVATLANHEGASAQELEVGQRAARGAAVASLFDKVMAEKKYGTAQAILNTWSDKIDANTATKLKLGLDGRVSIQVGEQLADEAWRGWGSPAYSSGAPDRAYNIVLGLETPGSQAGKDGKVITSSTGNFGRAQLGEDTAKDVAKSLGRPELADLAKKTTKEGEAANLLLGKTYFNQLVTQFKGDIQKAMAAYNAGPAWLVGGKDRRGNKIEGALPRAAREGGDWRDYLPAETQKYIKDGMKSFGAGEGSPAKPKKADLYAAIDRRTDDPDVRRAAYARLDHQFANADYDERESYETSYSEGLRVVRETGGNINALPPELKASIKPEQFTTLQTYAKNIRDGQYTSTRPEAYYTGMIAAMNPNTTVGQIEAMRPDLSEGDFKTVQNAWLERKNPAQGKGPESLDVSTVDSVVKTRLQYLGVDVNPKKGDTAGEARLGAISQFVHQYILDRQRQTGTKLVEYGDIEREVNQMFTRDQGFRTKVMGITTGQGRQGVLTTTVKDMPTDVRAQLKQQFKQAKGRDPQDAELLQMYWRSQFYTNSPGRRASAGGAAGGK